MKRKSIVPACLLLFITSLTIAQKSYKDVEGSWSGRLKSDGSELTLVMNFTLISADSVKLTFDSPEQGAFGLPGGKAKIAGDTLVAPAPTIYGQYKGAVINDTLIKGNWTQRGRSFPLDMTKLKEPVKYLRPQEPKEPLPYRNEEVTFRNAVGNFDLAGTLTLPEGNGPFTAIVLISGSGAQDRNETIMNHKPFLVLADYLTRKGIAVLRYDDRGVGKSKGNMTNATTLTLADDAEAAVEYLLTRPEIDSKHIGLAGHSEGGMIAPIVASRNNNIAFIVSLAGTGVSGDNLIIKQNKDILRAEGLPEKEIEHKAQYLDKIFQIVRAESDQKKVVKDALDWYNRELDSKNITAEERKTRMSEFTQALISVNSPWFKYFVSTDPAQFWSKVKCPVLALNGEKDLQVNYEQNLPAIKAALKKGGNRKVRTVSLPSLNHLFQHCTTGSPKEYATIEETFSPGAMEIITEWVIKTSKK